MGILHVFFLASRVALAAWTAAGVQSRTPAFRGLATLHDWLCTSHAPTQFPAFFLLTAVPAADKKTPGWAQRLQLLKRRLCRHCRENFNDVSGFVNEIAIKERVCGILLSYVYYKRMKWMISPSNDPGCFSTCLYTHQPSWCLVGHDTSSEARKGCCLK